MGWIAAGTAIAGLGGAVLTSNAAGDAAKTQAAAADRASQAAQAQAAQTRADLSPYRDAGGIALGSWLTSVGLPGGSGPNLLAANGINGLTFQPTQAALEATPGYQFNLSQGLKSIGASNAAKGLGVSGAALKGATSFATGLADNTLKTQQGIFQSNLGNVLSPLQFGANLGQNAAATTGQQGLAGTNAANQASLAGAAASAAGTVGSGNALAGGLGSIGNAGPNYLLYNKLFGSGSGSAASSFDLGPSYTGWLS